MTQFKEFQGKTLDEAIQEACSYYGVGREKLEIDIVNDAKTGIFGLVGAKKATIRARRFAVEAFAAAEEAQPKRDEKRAETSRKNGGSAQGKKKQTAPRGENSPAVRGEDTPALHSESSSTSAPAALLQEAGEAELPASRNMGAAPVAPRAGRKNITEAQAGTARRSPAPRPAQRPRPALQETQREAPCVAMTDDMEDGGRESIFACLDGDMAENACTVACEVVLRLIFPIVGEVPCEAEVHEGRLRIALDCGDSAGILVGREGQTLASIQYLAARLIAKQLGGAVRLQIDVGNYRERQDERLRDMALFLGDKAKKTRRAQVTRPLSAYQRRIIHLALEGDTELQTHSKGEGAQRRVVVQVKRGNRKGAAAATEQALADEESDILPENFEYELENNQ